MESEYVNTNAVVRFDNLSKYRIKFDLIWKTEPPTKPGWYWINELINGESALSVHWFTYAPSDSIITHWLGPLPTPELPK